MSQKNLLQTGSILEKGEQSFHQSSDLKVQGMEVLFFDHVELTKNEVGSNSFLEMGTLRVLYFPEYDRFILVLGNWEYALLKRLTITSSSKTDLQTRTFTLQTYHGLHVLKINKIVHPEALQNFETILSYTTKFSYFGEDVLVRRNEVSPDASLLENPEEIETEPSSSKSSFLRTNPEEGDPLSLHGKERIKRGFAKMIDKLSGNYFQKIGEKNLFLTQIMNFEDMKDLAVEFAPKHFFGRKEVISNSLICYLNF